MTSIRTETETVIKKILPYLERRGYDLKSDFDFETAVVTAERYSKGYIDVLVNLGKPKPVFLIEAKKISKKLNSKDRDQAISYARSSEINVPFVVVTNGIEIQCFNTKNKNRILWDGKPLDKIPSKEQLKIALRTLKSNPDAVIIPLSSDSSLPYRPGLPLRQLNALFYKNHSMIRKIEKDEDNAFADFSKLLFLKLLEEKNDNEDDFELPYSYRFYELAEKPVREADQVKVAILSMIDAIIDRTSYGDVLKEGIKLNNPRTFYNIVKSLASVSFTDCSYDSKGAAFEYFVRATLKGKKLGQYFTPRELVQCMLALVGREKIVTSVLSGSPLKIIDPACGTGGFLVFLLQDALIQLQDKLKGRKINRSTYDNAVEIIKRRTFYGSDANKGVAASAKMNMIIAGDGHTNIQHEDSLSSKATNWSTTFSDCDLILTNPPFGTSEADSLTANDLLQYDISSTKGQHLFIQKMIKATNAGGEICTVIDEGVLNTDSAASLRKYILKHCRLIAAISLPGETFKPNKINVKSSLLYLEKRDMPDEEFEDVYKTTVCEFKSLGYQGSGDKIRGFNLDRLLNEISTLLLDQSGSSTREGYNWKAFDVDVQDLVNDYTHRFDYKYWNSETRKKIEELSESGNLTVAELNTIPTQRGKSPSAENYVDEVDGYALVIKAGSNISKFGKIITKGADWIEKAIYDELLEKGVEIEKVTGEPCNLSFVRKGDVVLASTGDGTLGKCAVYDLEHPAVADGHVTIIRPDLSKIDPYYLADYLRNGFGAIQVSRLFTGSTGLIELTPEQVNRIVVDLKSDIKEQQEISKALRSIELNYLAKLNEADLLLVESKSLLN
ncbi:N-6 DNA methylase [Pontibacter sp. BT310]|uniref:site-specific DNA-methyltransferase (adenine-specific) n=1 Tax=Pontibacter populi TaxID=890055 RepID=A0ABS6XFD7_9BACT|nr:MULTISPECIES: N-6 DNA methylase [Pontibacter]MBJ6119500.1 N-6 DNA methylase [Pontibacter sp. BT310]MBR0571928.1 N-6 DNA methylase [Microvirga sp. STS03]MBW3366354.1 N-6 DNA methylase [Pontibacter populi]